MTNLRDLKTLAEKRNFLEKELDIPLKNIGSFTLSEDIAGCRNCENMIGVSQIPLGVAGPLILNTKYQILNTYVPLATTEGALVASVNRGCKAINESGGAATYLEKVGMTRGPVFKTNSLSESFKLKDWLANNLISLNKIAESTSGHLKLLKIESQVLGKNVYARFYFDTGEAMGMNMATIAIAQIVPFIEKETGVCCVALSGNFCVDKKPSFMNFLLGRGRKVWAEIEIPEKIVNEVLKTTPQKIYETWLNKCLLGSVMSGSMSFNSHFANIIAAIFAATGQDLGHITEGSLGVTVCEIVNNNIYMSVYLPDLIIGTVGGGTGLETQKEAMSIIFGKDKPETDKFAQIIAGAVLAGELSLLASLAEGSLACAHQKLGRGKSA